MGITLGVVAAPCIGPFVLGLLTWVAGMAAYFMRPLLPQTAATAVLAAVALTAGLHLGWIDRSPAGFRAFGWLKAGAGIAGVVTATFLIGSLIIQGPGVKWDAYSDHL